jgi:hypothetical protein
VAWPSARASSCSAWETCETEAGRQGLVESSSSRCDRFGLAIFRGGCEDVEAEEGHFAEGDEQVEGDRGRFCAI